MKSGREFRWVGYDPKGIKRVFGVGASEAEAKAETHQAARDYITRRPDTGPLTGWLFLEDGWSFAWDDTKAEWTGSQAHRVLA